MPTNSRLAKHNSICDRLALLSLTSEFKETKKNTKTFFSFFYVKKFVHVSVPEDNTTQVPVNDVQIIVFYTLLHFCFYYIYLFIPSFLKLYVSFAAMAVQSLAFLNIKSKFINLQP